MRFHRKEQMQKLKTILTSLITFKRIDSFQTKVKLNAPQ
jgi:hypothetical protein